MKTVPFENGKCDKTRARLDAYLSGELTNESNLELVTHLGGCAECQREADHRAWVRNRVRAAVTSVEVSPFLAERIRARLAEPERPRLAWRTWAAAAAVVTVAVAGSVIAIRNRPQPFHQLDRVSQNAYIERVSTGLSRILKVGFGHHLHCLIARNPAKGKDQPVLDKEWIPLMHEVRRIVPAEYEMLMAHKCSWQKRPFVHFAFRGRGKQLSLIMTRKREGEVFQVDQILPELRAHGIAVYQQGAAGYEVTGFESSQYLAFLVSDLDRDSNLKMAAALAVPVREFLERL